MNFDVAREKMNFHVARQKIFNKSGKIFAFELLFRDHPEGIKNFPTNLKATSQVLMNVLTHMDIEKVLGKDSVAFINVDESVLESGIINILDPKKFVLEILETTNVTNTLIKNIKSLKEKGFKIAIDDFDCSHEMMEKFKYIFQYISIVKIDILSSDQTNIDKIISAFKKKKIIVLAEKVETQEQYKKYVDMGCDLFQGYHLAIPETISVKGTKEVTKVIVLQLINIIKNNDETSKLENLIKQRPDLSYKLIRFINNQSQICEEIKSITQVITLIGREQLLRWLLIYLYTDVDNPISEQLLAAATQRANKMEKEAEHDDKEKAFMVGMLSMLDILFETDIKILLKGIKIDHEITNAVINSRGKFASSLKSAIVDEKKYLLDLMLNNFNRINVGDIIYTLEINGIHVYKNKKL